MLSQSTKVYKSLIKQFSRRINLSLERMEKALTLLGFPHLELPNPINILGSDGKFSTLTSLKYFLEAHKKKVTAYTSPHLFSVVQRFWLKNRYISLKEILKYKKQVEAVNVKLTLFELLTCIYFLAAREQKGIYASLVESGLLMKFDAGNVFTEPKAQIITNINKQHLEWVHPKTLAEICRQKCGSLSNNATIYVAKQKPKTLKIIKNILKKNKSKIIYASNYKVKKVKDHYVYKDSKNIIPIKSKYIFSEGLINNVGTAIKVALDLGVPKKTIIKTIPKISFEGRIQYLKKGKFKKLLNKQEELLIDGCHSQASAENLYHYLKTLKKPVYCIWGMQKNKLPEIFIKVFKGLFKKVVTVTIPNEPNATKAGDLKVISQKYFPTSSAKNIQSAIKQISSKEDKVIVILGSLYLIGYVLGNN